MNRKIIISSILMTTILLLTTGIGITRAWPTDSQVGSPNQTQTVAVTNGSPIGRPFLIGDQPVNLLLPVVAYNGQRHEYLVVWWNLRASCDDIYGQRLSKDGTLIGNWFAVAAGCPYKRSYPHVTYNSQQNEYLVVWQQEFPGTVISLYGQLISATGQLQGGAITIAAGSTTTGYAFPAVAYASTSGKYLVVYISVVTATSGYHVGAQALNDDGAAWGAAFDVTPMVVPALVGASWPELVYNPLLNEFLVVWEQTNSSQEDIMARRVKMASGADGLGSVFMVSADTSKNEQLPAVGSLPRAPDGQYLVTWQYKISGTNTDIQGQLVSGSGSLEGGLIKIANSPLLEVGPGVAGSATGDKYLVTSLNTDTSTIYDCVGRTIGVAGLVGPDFWLGEARSDGPPSVIAGANGDVLAVFSNQTSSTTLSKVWGRLVGNRIYLPALFN